MPENTYPPQYERWHDDQGPPTYAPPPTKKDRRVMWILGAVLAALVVLVLCLVGIFTSHKGDKTQAHPSQVATATHAPSRAVKAEPPIVKATPKRVTITDGTYEVGTEVKPGTYTTDADKGGSGCYWARLKDFDGGVNSIQDNGNLAPGAHGRINIKSTDKGVELTGGCVWTKTK